MKVSPDSGGATYVARMAYDGDGQRRKRLDTFGTIHYAGAHYERNAGNGQDTSDTVTKNYWAHLGPYRRLVAVRKGGTLSFLHHDHLGSTKALSGGTFKYYPFGYAYQEVFNPPTDNLYTGQKRDLSTGLYYYGARYYDAAIGRFVQPDSIVPQPGNPQSLNRYSYVLNNPLRYTDPSGLDLMIVPGMGGEEDWQDPKSWKDWIVRYAGEDTWNGFYEAWTGPGTDKQAVARQFGVNIFDWRAVSGGSIWGDISDAAGELNRQMAGMENITVIAHSKGGAVAEEFIAQARRSGSPPDPRRVLWSQRLLDPTEVKRFVFVDPAIGPVSEFFGALFGLGIHRNVISAADTGADITTINNWLDLVGGRVSGGRNYQDLAVEPFSFPQVYSRGLHGLKTYRALTVFPPGAGAW